MSPDQPQRWRKEWGSADETQQWIQQIVDESDMMEIELSCVFHTRLVIPARLTPSGRRYTANPGQVIAVYLMDRDALLKMTSKQKGCPGCGGSAGVTETPYFEEV